MESFQELIYLVKSKLMESAADSVFSFLSIGGEQRLVGSAADPKVLYSADYDLIEYSHFPKNKEIYLFILDLFRMKYILESKFNLVITDFKCGTFKGSPVRWDSKSISQGYTYIEDTIIYFVDCLQMKSRIKMDVIKDNTEYSSIYIIDIGDYSLQYKETMKIAMKSLYSDYLKYREYNVFKALKRLYSFLKLKGQGPLDQVLKVLNSYLGKKYQSISKLETKLKLMEFRNSGNSKKAKLSDLIKEKIKDLNLETKLFIEKNNLFKI
jgi:hypothetical protein